MKNYLYFWNKELYGTFTYHAFINKINNKEYVNKDLKKIRPFIRANGSYLIVNQEVFEIHCNLIVDNKNILCVASVW